jgi:SAM-dependent methyltransferase
MPVPFFQDQQAMRRGWNDRAARDPFFYVETAYWDGNVDRFFALGENTTRRLIDPLLSGFGIPRGTALDIGCGPGRFSRALARRFDSVVAVDVSDQMIAKAKELNSERGRGNITFRVNDGVTLPVGDRTMDFVWSYEVFQHSPSQEIIQANILEVGRVLRPSGLAMIHLKTGYFRPAVHFVLRHLPPKAIALAMRLAGVDPLLEERTFRGAPPLRLGKIKSMIDRAGLTVLAASSDPTHPKGTRAFTLVGDPLYWARYDSGVEAPFASPIKPDRTSIG